MKRSKELKEARRQYVKQVVASSISTTNAVRQLSRTLFVTESTIWSDLKK